MSSTLRLPTRRVSASTSVSLSMVARTSADVFASATEVLSRTVMCGRRSLSPGVSDGPCGLGL